MGKFSKTWVNQTKLAELFGISSIKMGKELVKLGLREGKDATESAIKQQYAIKTPLKDGTPFYMWNKQKVFELLKRDLKPATELEKWISKAKTLQEQIDRTDYKGMDKMAWWAIDDLIDECPKEFRKEVEKVFYGDNDNNLMKD